MKDSSEPAWVPVFLAALERGCSQAAASREAKIAQGTAHSRRKRHPGFCDRWDAASTASGVATTEQAIARGISLRSDAARWQKVFIEALAETSNVTAAASAAGKKPFEVYLQRRKNLAFAEKWQAALYEGYCNLEMEVLGYLRDPAPERKLDVASALRLLAAHRENAAREKAQRAGISAAEVRASIERKVEAMRRQVAERKARETR